MHLDSKMARVGIDLLLCLTVIHIERVEYRDGGKCKRLWLEFQLRPLHVAKPAVGRPLGSRNRRDPSPDIESYLVGLELIASLQRRLATDTGSPCAQGVALQPCYYRNSTRFPLA